MKNTIVILGTLHQYHLKQEFYSLDVLERIIERINPDVICVELTAEDLKTEREQRVKVEYPMCILPLAKKRGYKIVPMEPDEPEYSRLINIIKQLNKKIESDETMKMKSEIFNQYTESLYEFLFNYWKSPADVNSDITNALFEVKHKFQDALFGPLQREGWEEWNIHFLNTILKTMKKYKGKKILVTVGAEHVYWLKKRLKNNSTIKLEEISEILNR